MLIVKQYNSIVAANVFKELLMDKEKLSFIIPALNEETHIGGVLDSISMNVGGHFSYEVIVVDNGSEDRTMEIAEINGANCLYAPGCTISTLRNMGVSEASFEILVFLDADVYLGAGWGGRIGMVIERLHSQPNLVTGSLYGISEQNNWIERIWFAPRTSSREQKYINGGHLILHRNLFAKVGGFDPSLETGEDYEFCIRAKRMGAKIENDPELRVVHAGYPKSIKIFFNRERWHGRGDCKSFKTLVSSKPAVVSLTNFCMAGTCTFGMFLGLQVWLTLSVYVFFLGSVSLAASYRRLRGKFSSTDFLGITLLYMVYFTARTVSIVDVALQPASRGVPSCVSVGPDLKP